VPEAEATARVFHSGMSANRPCSIRATTKREPCDCSDFFLRLVLSNTNCTQRRADPLVIHVGDPALGRLSGDLRPAAHVARRM